MSLDTFGGKNDPSSEQNGTNIEETTMKDKQQDDKAMGVGPCGAIVKFIVTKVHRRETKDGKRPRGKPSMPNHVYKRVCQRKITALQAMIKDAEDKKYKLTLAKQRNAYIARLRTRQKAEDVGTRIELLEQVINLLCSESIRVVDPALQSDL